MLHVKKFFKGAIKRETEGDWKRFGALFGLFVSLAFALASSLGDFNVFLDKSMTLSFMIMLTTSLTEIPMIRKRYDSKSFVVAFGILLALVAVFGLGSVFAVTFFGTTPVRILVHIVDIVVYIGFYIYYTKGED